MGAKNLENLNNFSGFLKEELDKNDYDGHLILVGGNVMPEKKGKIHKDVDLLFYSKDLCIKNIKVEEDDQDFAKFAEFFKGVGDKLDFNEKVKTPYYFDYMYCFDGSIQLIPENGVPLEIIPVRKDRQKDSIEDFLKNDERPMVVLF